MTDRTKVDKLEFQPDLIPDILSGKKTNTWRIWPDKYVVPGDVVKLINFSTKAVFASAQILEKCEKTFNDLTDQDRAGHETFASSEAMYQAYSAHYKIPVNDSTAVTIIKFQLA